MKFGFTSWGDRKETDLRVCSGNTDGAIDGWRVKFQNSERLFVPMRLTQLMSALIGHHMLVQLWQLVCGRISSLPRLLSRRSDGSVTGLLRFGADFAAVADILQLGVREMLYTDERIVDLADSDQLVEFDLNCRVVAIAKFYKIVFFSSVATCGT